MLTRTTELAIKTVIYVGIKGSGQPLSPKKIAEALDCSPSYLAKTTNLLVKAGVLRSLRGIKGGVVLAKDPEDTNLLEIVEACQGLLIGDYCQEMARPGEVCTFHQTMKELHEATLKILSSCTLKNLMASPARCFNTGLNNCRMFFEGCEKYPS
jgi:Rrf2 family protein